MYIYIYYMIFTPNRLGLIKNQYFNFKKKKSAISLLRKVEKKERKQASQKRASSVMHPGPSPRAGLKCSTSRIGPDPGIRSVGLPYLGSQSASGVSFPKGKKTLFASGSRP